METTTMRRGTAALRSRWTLPLFCLILGGAFLAAQWAGGDLGDGLVSLAIMSAVGLLFLVGGRWDAIRQLRADTQDERGAQIDLKATAFAGMVVITVVIAGFLVEMARGEDGSPYTQIGTIGGVAYIVALIVLRRRS
jgi:hypothetical protein